VDAGGTNQAPGVTLDPEQDRAVTLPGGRLKLVGPAGSGKTTALLERAARLVAGGADPAGVLVLVRDRRASIEWRDVLVRRLGRSTAGPSVFTFHAFAWSLLSRAFPVEAGDEATAEVGYQLAGFDEEPVLLTAFDQRAFVRQLLAGEDAGAWPVNGGLLGSNAFAGEVRDFLLRAQERLLTPLDVRRLAEARRRADWAELAGFYGRYVARVQDASGFEDGRPRLDFAMVLAEARRTLGEHPAVAADLRSIYPHVLVDDFEEANRAEAALLEALLPSAEDVSRSGVVAGDPEGTVFGFRGADPSCLRELDAPELRLRNLHRRTERPEVRVYARATEEAKGVVAELRRAAASGVAAKDMAVIVRDYRGVLAPLRRELKRAGLAHQVDGEAVHLAGDPVVRPVLDLFTVVCRRPGHEELWPALLTSELGGLTAPELLELRRAARLAGVPLSECCRAEAVDLPPRLAAKLSAFCALVDAVGAWARRLPPDECFWRLWQRADWFERVVASGDERRLDSLTTLADAMGRFVERRGVEARLADFIETLESAEFAPESVRLSPPRDAVTVLTAHGSKGREFELAIVAGCVEDVWPDPSRRGALLDLDLLDGPLAPAQRQQRALAEEQRLFDVATSRSRRLVVSALRAGGSERLSAEPSRFLDRLGVEIPEPDTGSASDELVLSPREAEIAWRRRVVDPSCSAEQRLASAWALARLPGVDPARWWGGRTWTANPTPVVPAPKKSSYSRFSAYENCPLQYLLGQVLGLDPDRTYHMAFGSLIHGLLEDAEAGRLAKDADVLVEEARRRWRPEDYPPGAVSNFLWRDCEAILRRYVEFEADNGHKTLCTEQWFEFGVGEWQVRGKIDRIDRLDGDGIRLIDYKTSSSYKSDEDTATDLQLATYFVACERDERLRELGRAKCAELVYVRLQKGNALRRAPQYPRKSDDGVPWTVFNERRIAELLEAIDREDFAPSPEADCRFCNFKPLCPLWPEGEELKTR
jgi:superfamily I DNA/RNA helicase/RecB family exonuclease